MTKYLSIAVRFLQGMYHGRADGGEPEWPPSPLRLFQALVAAAAARANERELLQSGAPALLWLEDQAPPLIVAPAIRVGAKYRLYVPDNVTDLVAKSWARGNDANITDYRTEKDVRPTHIMAGHAEDRAATGDAIHYLWSIADDEGTLPAQLEALEKIARSVTHVGWGVDQVVAHAQILTKESVAALSGHRWIPVESPSDFSLRVPCRGTLRNLGRKHTAFLGRAGRDTFRPVPPLSTFSVQHYQPDTQLAPSPFAAFGLLQNDAEAYCIFDTARRGLQVAGMMRHAASHSTIATSLGWTQEKVGQLILGHAEPEGSPHIPVDGHRIAFLPLPSLESRGGKSKVRTVGAIRRVLVAGLRGISQQEISALAQRLANQHLIDEASGKPVALLSRLPRNESMVCEYTRPSATWATVTPVILPGFDDPGKYRRRLGGSAEDSAVTSKEQRRILEKLDSRVENLLRKAIRQAGYSEELATHAGLEWRATGFLPGADLATRYHVPEKFRRFRRVHVRITWSDRRGNQVSLPGPICLGRGRFSGLGLFAAI
ncbi:type I-U CRISPR-associated protein Cas5/Cas6 [Verrucomicrobia bacterium LW23]|nr:type I-U CRISPR-associated protein Cas5/Cas6 [Verrucomicrobia bacterium LW23]